MYTVVKGHWIACACEILGITDVDGAIDYPRDLLKDNLEKKREFVEGIARQVVDRLTLVESAFVAPGEMADSGDTCYNYHRRKWVLIRVPSAPVSSAHTVQIR